MSRDKMADQVLGMIPIFHRKLIKKFKDSDFKRGEFHLLHKMMMVNGLPINSYGEKLSISKPNLTKLVNDLVEKGWVEKVKSEKDRRVIRIYITDDGREVIMKHYKLMKLQVIEATKKLTDEEVETLVANFESIQTIFTKLDDAYDE